RRGYVSWCKEATREGRTVHLFGCWTMKHIARVTCESAFRPRSGEVVHTPYLPGTEQPGCEHHMERAERGGSAWSSSCRVTFAWESTCDIWRSVCAAPRMLVRSWSSSVWRPRSSRSGPESLPEL